MARKYSVYWYKTPAIGKAHLYNCRDRDLRPGTGIPKGSLINGAVGFAIAETDVPSLTGKIMSRFRAMRICEWMGFTLSCMAHPRVPQGRSPKSRLRDYNYVVADVSDSAVEMKARSVGIPVIEHCSGARLINLEISDFERQGRGSVRRAKLL